MNKDRMKNLLIVGLALVATLAIMFNVWQYATRLDEQGKITTETVVIKDTVKVESPTATKERFVGWEYVPADSIKAWKTGRVKESVISLHDTVVVSKKDENINMRNGTILSNETDTSGLFLPVAQVQWTDDSTYTAWVSGYHPKLDSIHVYRRNVCTTTTVFKTRKLKRWNVGLQAGYGYGLESRKIEPFIGAGITYNIFR